MCVVLHWTLNFSRQAIENKPAGCHIWYIYSIYMQCKSWSLAFGESAQELDLKREYRKCDQASALYPLQCHILYSLCNTALYL